MKKIIITCIIAALLLVGYFFVGGILSGDDLSPHDVKEVETSVYFGVLMPEDGEDDLVSYQEVLGYKFANTQKNEIVLDEDKLEIRLLEIDEITKDMFTEGSRTSPSKMMIGNKPITALLTTVGSKLDEKAMALLADASVPVIGGYATRSSQLDEVPGVFSVCGNEIFESSTTANYAYGKNYNEAAIISLEGDTHSEVLKDGFIKEFEDLGGRTFELSFDAQKTTFDKIISEIKHSEADMIYICGNAEKIGLFAKQARKYRIELPIFCGGDGDSTTLMEVLFGLDDVYIASPFDGTDSDSELSSEFGARFKSWILSNTERLRLNGGSSYISALSAKAADAYTLAVEAIDISQTREAEDAMEAISSVAFDGVSGGIDMSNGGKDLTKTIYIKMLVPFREEFEVLQKSSTNR